MTVFTETIVTYVTVDTVNPGLMVTTYVSIDLLYIPCGCEEQVYPSVEMTTITCPCRACGSQGENTVTLTVPEAACQSTGYGYPLAQLPSGWIGGYETDSSGNRFVVAQPTSGPQNDLHSYFSIPVQGSRVTSSSKQATGKPSIPNEGSTEPSDNNQSPSAEDEGFYPSHPAAANSNQQGSDYSNRSGSKIVTTPAPQPGNPTNPSGSYQGPGNESGNRPGSETSKGSEYVEPSNSREGSENFTNSENETATMSTSKPKMEVRPSGSSNQPQVASTLETKTGEISKEMSGPESTQTLSASGSEESGKSPLTVSEANGNRDMPWTMIVGKLVIGIVLVL
ncbi:hypothetical protein FDENT_4058 [Fusarium denticulatum]|uniref:Uncharacterized protein n=1 Tax=Fusarium denticulatum TaxID=48507 RepID=A0A8H5XBW9_9HYPO|nr:hypothetical protein FDENT_4058 [Fusarium denticulatum]